MIKIAITGGIGSGKTMVSNLLQTMGYVVFSCDKIANGVLNDPTVIKKISTFAKDCVIKNANGTYQIDKKALSNVVFTNEKLLQKLTDITHPLILTELLNQINNANQNLVFAEVPILFEKNYQNYFDKIIVVTRPLNDRINSVISRNNCTKQEVLNRINSQFDYSKLNKSDYIVINNDKDILALQTQIENILKTLNS